MPWSNNLVPVRRCPRGSFLPFLVLLVSRMFRFTDHDAVHVQLFRLISTLLAFKGAYKVAFKVHRKAGSTSRGASGLVNQEGAII